MEPLKKWCLLKLKLGRVAFPVFNAAFGTVLSLAVFVGLLIPSRSYAMKAYRVPLELESTQALQVPLHPTARQLPVRTEERYITLHYSGVVYDLPTKAAEYAKVVAEARYHATL